MCRSLRRRVGSPNTHSHEIGLINLMHSWPGEVEPARALLHTQGHQSAGRTLGPTPQHAQNSAIMTTVQKSTRAEVPRALARRYLGTIRRHARSGGMHRCWECTMGSSLRARPPASIYVRLRGGCACDPPWRRDKPSPANQRVVQGHHPLLVCSLWLHIQCGDRRGS
jgi:hypothetical protein